MTNGKEAIVNPMRGKHTPKLGPVAVMAGSETDLDLLCRQLDWKDDRFRKLFISRLYVDQDSPAAFALAGPMIGAPYATMILETLIAWGSKKILFFGWCGAVAHKVKIGDIILPTGAIIDEGTSRHYFSDMQSPVRPAAHIADKTRQVLNQRGLLFHEGLIWSTDAIYRETREKVEFYQAQNALAVEMEISALFTVAQYRKVELGALLVVSDELATFQWQPGFRENAFRESRKAVVEVMKSLCQII